MDIEGSGWKQINQQSMSQHLFQFEPSIVINVLHYLREKRTKTQALNQNEQ